ncbi:MAG: M1 family metallopeptidase, partial [Anaerolineae bacterium]
MKPRLRVLLVLCAFLLLPFPVARSSPPGTQPRIRLAATAPDIASYTLDVTLDAEAKTLSGHEVVTYHNTTPDPIPDLLFHLYLNAFRSEDSLFLREGGASSRGYSWDRAHAGWIEVTAIRLAGGLPLTLAEIEDGTLARAALPTPVAPGDSVRIELDFEAQLPRVLARTGYAGDFFMVGQWFPKLGVWQDGAWNAYPFHANAEFYADFGDYDVTIILPDDYVTGATGLPVSTLDNGDGTQTVRYRAEGVIDFAWTASPHFQAATRQVDGIDVVYLYLPEHDWTVARALDAAEAAVTHYGAWYGPYPYPRLTVVDVPDDGEGAGGMEYPTLVTAGSMSAFGLPGLSAAGVERSLEMVVVHEIGHQWWQSTVAFNEAEEPWLDEGFTEYSSVRLMSQLFGPDCSFLDSRAVHMGAVDMRRFEYLSTPQVPMYGPAWQFEFLDYVVAADAKPALSLLT